MNKQLKETITSNYPDWHHLPLRLTLEEMDNPKMVLENFFTGYHLPQAREYLKQLMLDALRAEDISAIDHVTFCDDLEKLVEGVWMLQKETASNSIPTDKDKPGVHHLIDLIVLAINPEKIFSVNKEPADLIIVLPDTCQKPFAEYQTVLEAFTMGYESMYFSIHKTAELNRQLAEGHLLYSLLCIEANLVYDNGKSPLYKPPISFTTTTLEKASNDFNAGMRRAISFLVGANEYFNTEDYVICAFMGQQAIELTFRAIILALSGYDARVHSITALKKQCRRVAPFLNQLLPGDTPQEERLLALLEKAYLNGRYADNFEIDVPDLKLLLERVETIQATARKIFEQKITVFANL